MTIVINGFRQAADVRIERLTLRAIVGAYELLFAIRGTAKVAVASAKDEPAWFVVHSALASVTAADGKKQQIGTVRPDRPFRVVQDRENEVHVYFELKVVLSPYQVSALEDLCQEQDMRFELQLIGSGGIHGQAVNEQVFNSISLSVPRSQWIEQLRAAGFLDILMIEVPVPVTDVPPEWLEMAKQLKHAQRLFSEGHYPECISWCRAVMGAGVGNDPVSVRRANAALKTSTASGDGNAMPKDQREIAIFAAVRNYTHLAHHPGEVGPSVHFTRDEAKLILTLSATLAAFIFSVGGGRAPVE